MVQLHGNKGMAAANSEVCGRATRDKETKVWIETPEMQRKEFGTKRLEKYSKFSNM